MHAPLSWYSWLLMRDNFRCDAMPRKADVVTGALLMQQERNSEGPNIPMRWRERACVYHRVPAAVPTLADDSGMDMSG